MSFVFFLLEILGFGFSFFRLCGFRLFFFFGLRFAYNVDNNNNKKKNFIKC